MNREFYEARQAIAQRCNFLNITSKTQLNSPELFARKILHTSVLRLPEACMQMPSTIETACVTCYIHSSPQQNERVQIVFPPSSARRRKPCKISLQTPLTPQNTRTESQRSVTLVLKWFPLVICLLKCVLFYFVQQQNNYQTREKHEMFV